MEFNSDKSSHSGTKRESINIEVKDGAYQFTYDWLDMDIDNDNHNDKVDEITLNSSTSPRSYSPPRCGWLGTSTAKLLEVSRTGFLLH